MAEAERDGDKGTRRSYDAVIVGGSLAGCAAATMLGRAGARVAVLEKSPDPAAFKRICSHFIQASAVPTLERLGLLEPMMDGGRDPPALPCAGAVGVDRGAAGAGRARGQPAPATKLDPMAREMAASTPGVELLLGQTVTELRRAGGKVSGVVARDRDGTEVVFEAPLTIGADGRDSTIAKLSGVKVKTYPHGPLRLRRLFRRRRAEGRARRLGLDDGPRLGGGLPHRRGPHLLRRDADQGPTARVQGRPRGGAGRLLRIGAGSALAARGARLDERGILGKIDMTNRMRVPTAPGLALIGDAALATDPLFGVGCGWAFQSAEWLADSVAPALRGEEELEKGLRRYRRTHSRHLRGHAWMIHDYATGRKMQPPERLIFSGAARDPRVAAIFDDFGARQIGATKMIAVGTPLALLANAR